MIEVNRLTIGHKRTQSIQRAIRGSPPLAQRRGLPRVARATCCPGPAVAGQEAISPSVILSLSRQRFELFCEVNLSAHTMQILRVITAMFFLGLFATDLLATEQWSPEKKEACIALLTEYPSKIESKFKNDNIKQGWHRLLLTDDAIHFSRVSFSNYHNEISQWLRWEQVPIYRSDEVLNDKDDLWRIQIIEPHPVSSDSTTLVIFISLSSKKIVSAWETPGG